jgi:plasmid stabilization system protein ParE
VPAYRFTRAAESDIDAILTLRATRSVSSKLRATATG